jgi:hypothetical protein
MKNLSHISIQQEIGKELNLVSNNNNNNNINMKINNINIPLRNIPKNRKSIKTSLLIILKPKQDKKEINL